MGCITVGHSAGVFGEETRPNVWKEVVGGEEEKEAEKDEESLQRWDGMEVKRKEMKI